MKQALVDYFVLQLFLAQHLSFFVHRVCCPRVAWSHVRRKSGHAGGQATWPLSRRFAFGSRSDSVSLVACSFGLVAFCGFTLVFSAVSPGRGLQPNRPWKWQAVPCLQGGWAYVGALICRTFLLEQTSCIYPPSCRS